MSLHVRKITRLGNQICVPLYRNCSQKTPQTSSSTETTAPATPTSQSQDAKSSVSKYAQADDNMSYQVPEYYQHDEMSYVDYEVEMLQYRLPQPSPSGQ